MKTETELKEKLEELIRLKKDFDDRDSKHGDVSFKDYLVCVCRIEMLETLLYHLRTPNEVEVTRIYAYDRILKWYMGGRMKD